MMPNHKQTSVTYIYCEAINSKKFFKERKLATKNISELI